MTGLAEEIAEIGELEALRRELRSTQQKLGQEKARTRGYIEALTAAAHAAYLAQGPVRVAKPKADRRRKSEHVALLHTTDWQDGKETSTYNMEVLDRRLGQMCDVLDEITDIMRAAFPVRSATVAFGGDIVEGVDIFPHQPWEVEAPLYEQLFHAANAMERVVRRTLTTFEHVDVVAEWGNHGRIGGKGKGVKASDNMDRVLYEIVRQRFLADIAAERLTWTCTSRWYQPLVIGEYRALLIHGDEIKNFGGQTPAYALVRKGNAWASGAVDFDFRDIYVGHYHNANSYSLAAGGTVYMTGSTESDNEYAREFVAASSEPSQRLHFVNPRAGRVVSEHKIWLD